VEDPISPPDRLRKTEGLEIYLVDDQCVVYDTAEDRIHYLNPTAALVLEFCDGTHSADDIAALVQAAYNLPAVPTSDVNACLSSLRDMAIIH
jgi:hypothetical protein